MQTDVNFTPQNNFIFHDVIITLEGINYIH